MTIDEVFKSASPFPALLAWLQAAGAQGCPEPTAMALATASGRGRPSARIVLFKGLGRSADGQEGLMFYTNYESRKSKEMSENPWGSVVFHWPSLQRQVRADGFIQKASAADSDRYFQSRPRGSQIGAWASPQSQPIPAREVLLKNVKDYEERFKAAAVPRPENWGGWILVPTEMEFWNGCEFRLHDRAQFQKDERGWHCRRLAP